MYHSHANRVKSGDILLPIREGKFENVAPGRNSFAKQNLLPPFNRIGHRDCALMKILIQASETNAGDPSKFDDRNVFYLVFNAQSTFLEQNVKISSPSAFNLIILSRRQFL